MTTNYTEMTSFERNGNPAAAAVPHVNTARAIVRTVALAADALDDRSVSYEDQAGPERWGAAVGKACEHMSLARDVLLNAPFAPGVDWVTPHALLEALDAALWRCASIDKAQRLTGRELIGVAVTTVESLDALLLQCAAAGDVHDARPTDSRSVH